LLAPFPPQNATAKVKSSSVRERAACLKRQSFFFHLYFDVRPVR
jgi:hypothetical protein